MPFIFKHDGRNIDLEGLGTDERFELIEEIPAGSEDELADDIDHLDDIDTHCNSENENVLENNFDKPYVVAQNVMKRVGDPPSKSESIGIKVLAKFEMDKLLTILLKESKRLVSLIELMSLLIVRYRTLLNLRFALEGKVQTWISKNYYEITENSGYDSDITQISGVGPSSLCELLPNCPSPNPFYCGYKLLPSKSKFHSSYHAIELSLATIASTSDSSLFMLTADMQTKAPKTT
ncbi:hypothetical protein FQA39_LY14954 [Lamprigera yunnana]|nr:hypothetical protein FQA39_LY14954 [Lamprigera yunnana]